MKYLNDVPLNLMPKVLAFVQESAKYSGTEDKNLGRLFHVIRSRPEIVAFADSTPPHAAHKKKTPMALIIAAAATVKLFVWWMWPKM